MSKISTDFIIDAVVAVRTVRRSLDTPHVPANVHEQLMDTMGLLAQAETTLSEALADLEIHNKTQS